MNSLAQKTLKRLKEALSRKGDLPSMSATLTRIVTSMKGSDESDDRLVQAVLSDVALTQKVLRLANSSMYSAFGGSVTTVSKAIFILGTETVGHLALGLKLLDNFGQAADSEIAQRELGMAVMSGVVARKVGSDVSGISGEEVAVAALLRCTGRLLVCFYLPEDFKVLDAKRVSLDEEDACASEILGLSYAEIAAHMAEVWHLPSELSQCMVDTALEPANHHSWVQAVAGYSRRYVSAISNGATQDDMLTLAERYSEAVGRPAADLLASAADAFESSEALSSRSAVTNRLALVPSPSVSTAAVVSGVPGAPAVAVADQTRSTLQKLVAGLAEAQGMEGSMRPPQVTGLIAELFYDAFACQRVMFFLRRPVMKSFELMLGFGAGVQDKLHQVKFEEAFSPNAFHVALSNAAPVYLANTADANIARRIPMWLRQEFTFAKSMLLVPLAVDNVPVGLLYLDWGPQGKPQPFTSGELSYIDHFRSLIERSFSANRNRQQAVPPAVAGAGLSV